jgi:hypothetical protein
MDISAGLARGHLTVSDRPGQPSTRRFSLEETTNNGGVASETLALHNKQAKYALPKSDREIILHPCRTIT